MIFIDKYIPNIHALFQMYCMKADEHKIIFIVSFLY